ncbi:MAG: hypothetical protein JRG83_01370 [Deltaproteobacteria bacterium]|nr:hypothetical protein [Deltaproteobacteria bacterium]
MRTLFVFVSLSCLLLGGFAPDARAGGSGLVIVPTIDRPGMQGDRSPGKGSGKYKIRDADGNLVAEGGIAGGGENESNPQPVTVDLPPGEYTVEVVYDDGATHPEGTSQYGGTSEVTVGGDGAAHPSTEVEVEPLTEEEVLALRVEDAEDDLQETEEALEELEQDIVGHVNDGDDVSPEHLEMLKELKKKLRERKKRLARLERMRRAKRLQLLGQLGAGGKKVVGGAPHIPHMPSGGGKGPPVRPGKY